MGCIFCKEKYSYNKFLDITSNYSTDSTGRLSPVPSEKDKSRLLDLYRDLPYEAKMILYATFIDNGAGTGIQIVGYPLADSL